MSKNSGNAKKYCGFITGILNLFPDISSVLQWPRLRVDCNSYVDIISLPFEATAKPSGGNPLTLKLGTTKYFSSLSIVVTAGRWDGHFLDLAGQENERNDGL